MPKASANIASVSPLHNRSLADLVDDLGALKAEIAALELREKALRDELIARGVESAAGAAFCATVAQAVRWTLDAAAIRSEMGESWATARSKVATVTTVKVSALPAIRLAA